MDTPQSGSQDSTPPPPPLPVGTPVLPQVTQHIAMPNDPVVGRVLDSRICTKSRKAGGFVRHITLDVSGTPLAGSWIAGQSFGVIPPGHTKNNKPHKLRLYSIASPIHGESPHQDPASTVSFTVKRLVDEHTDDHTLYHGVCSNYLCDLQIGDEVQLTGPVGKRFVLPQDPAKHDYMLIATGTGIAPFRAMIGDLVKLGMPSRVDLIMGAPYDSDLLYDEYFQELASTYTENFFYRTAISRHTSPDQPTKLYVQGRQEQDTPELEGMLQSPRTLIYICGIAGMELGIFKTMRKMLSDDALAQYLTIAPEAGNDPASWERSMIPRKLKPTKRLFLEVY